MDINFYVILLIGFVLGAIIVFNIFAFALGYIITLWNLEERVVLGLKIGEGQYMGRILLHYLDIKRMFMRKGKLIFAHGSEGQYFIFKMFGFHMLYGKFEKGRTCKKCKSIVFKTIILKDIKRTLYNNKDLSRLTKEQLENISKNLENGEILGTKEVTKQETFEVYRCEKCDIEYYKEEDLIKLNIEPKLMDEQLFEKATNEEKKTIVFYGQLPTKKRELKLYTRPVDSINEKTLNEMVRARISINPNVDKLVKEVNLIDMIDRPFQFINDKNNIYSLSLNEAVIEPAELFENINLVNQLDLQHQMRRREWIREYEKMRHDFIKREREFKHHIGEMADEVSDITAKEIRMNKMKITVVNFALQILEYVDLGAEVGSAVRKSFDEILRPQFTSKDGGLGIPPELADKLGISG